MGARALLALTAALVLAASPALAQRWGRGGGWGARARMAPPAGARGWGGGYGGGFGRRQGGPPWGRGGDGGYGPPGGPPPVRAFGPQRPAQAFRRGQIVPPGYRGARVDDPGRYHLRGAPNGYDWLGDGRDAYLVQRSTGMVMDSAPGAYEGPGPGAGRGRWGGRRGPRY